MAAARQAILSKFQDILSAMRPRPGGGLSTARFLPQFPLPVTLLDGALAYPSLMKDVQRDQAQQPQPQPQQQQQQQQQPDPVPLPLAARRGVDPAHVPAPAADQHRTSQPAARRRLRIRGGGRCARAPRQSAAEGARCAEPPAAQSALVAYQSAQQPEPQPQHATAAELPPVAIDVLAAPSEGQPVQPEAPPAGQTAPQPASASLAQQEAAGSGEQTEDEEWTPRAKRVRRSTAVALAHRKASVKASECAQASCTRNAVTKPDIPEYLQYWGMCSNQCSDLEH